MQMKLQSVHTLILEMHNMDIFQPILIWANYVLIIAPSDKITDNWTFLYFKNKFINGWLIWYIWYSKALNKLNLTDINITTKPKNRFDFKCSFIFSSEKHKHFYQIFCLRIIQCFDICQFRNYKRRYLSANMLWWANFGQFISTIIYHASLIKAAWNALLNNMILK